MIRRLQDLAWEGAELLRGALDVARWPFERAAWAVERAALWPLARRASALGAPARAAALGGLGALAAAALAFGAIRGGGEGGEAARVAAVPATPVEATSPTPKSRPAEPVLEGVVPDFTPRARGAAKVADAETVIATDPGKAASPEEPAAAASSAAKEPVKDPGPAAIEVARRFSGAFVLYETGRGDAEVRATIGKTASPRLAKALLRRPPRLPAAGKVPRAKVLNVVPGPRRGDTFTLSASLLRVGVASELRIDVRRDEESGRWRVTDVLG